ncbi:hypothetical protein BRADI_2g48431v3 [Brachypodium distachyon]|uniref:Uncharacterized protein n=1 Tax=Brachypodium distachyon TaxID=15368 RepID=A0A2K2DEN5_BRADI|nr:hypothetical protein BRADI_2g48431v3 [Brachypodium distachyon]
MAFDDLVRSLFSAPQALILGASPPAAASAVASATPRRSARQASKASSTPVAQRATIRLAKELSAINQNEKGADAAAAALVQRFRELLSAVDIDGLAVLTKVDRDALHRAATKASAVSAATTAT